MAGTSTQYANGRDALMKFLDPSICVPEYGTRCALAVMAKAPKAGKVKTRLVPPLTLEEAAALNVCFLRDTFANICEVRGAKGVVVYTPRGEEAAFEGIVPKDFGMLIQRGDTFGQRLCAAAADLLACGFRACCLVDSDSPTMPHVALQHAVDALTAAGDRVVLGPTDDGGYYLIGLKAEHSELFADIAWSTPAVFEETMARADGAALDVTLLPRWYDVDDGATLERLCGELFEERDELAGYAAPHTRQFVARLLEAERGDALWTAPERSGA